MSDVLTDNPIAGVIIAAEVGFWVVIAAGLVLRYPLRATRAGAVTLALVPLIDVALVVAVALDLNRGAEPGAVHGLAAVYLGFSVAFGPSLVRWADAHFAYRFADGPRPHKPSPGREKAMAMWREWLRVVAAAVIASVVLLGLLALVVEPGQADAMREWLPRVWLVVGVWFVAGPVWETGSALTKR